MGREYNVIDADGHILEPVDLWDKYIDPKFRARAPRMFVDTDGKDRLHIDGTIIGGPRRCGRTQTRRGHPAGAVFLSSWR